MKNQILDDIFHDSFLDELQEGEELLLDTRPYFSQKAKLKTISYVGFLPIAYMLGMLMDGSWFAFVFLAIFIPFGLWNIFYKHKKTRYLITNQRIIFRLVSNKWKPKIHSLELEKIKDFEIKEEGKDHGTIFLKLKKGNRPPFKTTNLKTDGQRKNITLELLENPGSVAQIIDQQIKRLN